MQNLIVRRMEEKDLVRVSEIEAANFSVPWSINGFRDALALSHTIFLVAELDGTVAGYVGCYQSFDEGEITNVAVEETLRGKGIAQRILEALLSIGKEQGITAVTLEVRESNTPAIRLYEKLGFESVGIRKRFYEKPTEDAVIMWWRES